MSEIICPHCQNTHPPGAKFCSVTGKTISASRIVCPQCGQELQTDWMACPNCGLILSTGMPTPQGASIRNPVSRKVRPWMVVFGAACIVLIGACSILYFLFGFNRRYQTAKIVPENTGALISISPSIFQLLQLRNSTNLVEAAAAFAAVPGILDAGEAIQRNLPLDLQIDPETDILPWIGPEVSLAVFYNEPYSGLAEGESRGSGLLAKSDIARYDGPPMMLGIATRNQKASDAFLEKLGHQLETKDVELRSFNYQDILITEIISPDHMPLAYASFNHLVVIATSADILRDSIDISRGSKANALYEQELYRDTLKELPGNRLGYIYLNWPSLAENIGVDYIEEIPIGNLHAIESMGFGFALNQEGLRFDYAVQYNLIRLSQAQIQSYQQSTGPNRLAALVPSDSLIYIAGQDLSLGWQVFQESPLWQEILDVERDIYSELGVSSAPQEIDPIEEIYGETGVHITRDLLDQMQGEYAWVILPDTNDLLESEFPFGLLFYTQVENSSFVEGNLRELFEFILEADTNLYKEIFNDVEVWFVEDQRGGGGMGYGFMGDTLFIGSSRRMLELAAQAANNPLSNNRSFQSSVNPLAESRGTVYMDMQETIRSYYRLMSDDEEESFNRDIRPYIESIQAVAMTTGKLNAEGWLHGGIFILTR